MSTIKRLLTRLVLTVVVVCFIAGTGLAAQEFDKKPVADEMIGSSGITWVPKMNYQQLVVTVSRPDGTVFSKTIDAGSTPYIGLSEIFGSSYSDGPYTYELRVIPVVEKKVRGARIEKAQSHKALTQSGTFLVKGGAIVTSVGTEREAPGLVSATPTGLDGTKDQVILDDLIVDGSLCVGMDCVNGESFGFDTIRLKENNLRIRFVDTSSTSSFPTRDWQITVNDSANGGANKFSIDDIDGGRTPFTIEAGAPSHSLYVDDGGRLGLGTSTPVVDVHVKSGNTPTLRLEQDGSSGFTPQTWDVAGNEANFFIRDATNGSTLPFRIFPGAASNVLNIAANDNVGIGTTSPDYSLEVERSGAGATIVANRSDTGATMELSATGNFGVVGTKLVGAEDHPVQVKVNGSLVMTVDNANPYLLMANGGGNYDGTNWNTGSSREIKKNIVNLTTDEAMAAFEGLSPVKFDLKKNKDGEDGHVGFIAEDVPDLVAVKGRKSVSAMDIVAVLTKVLKEQQKTISDLQTKVAALEKK